MALDLHASLHALLARRIREGLQLGSPAALALAFPACGGNVVVDATTSTGSGGGGSTTTTTTTTTGTTTFTCAPALVEGNTLVYECVPPGMGCLPVESSQLLAAFDATLSTSEPCPEDPSFCGCTNTVVAVRCGPDPNAAECCYYVEMHAEKFCEGRPFVVEARARVAAITPREGFAAPVALDPGALDAGTLDAGTRAALARAWGRDAQYEHASVASFARFVLELLALEAPADLVRGAQQAIADEIRHAELCFGIASRFAGEALGPGPLSVEGALAGRGDAAVIAAALVREGCIGETISALVALAARDAATDPGVRAALDEIAEDESAHAALAWRTAAWMWASGNPGVRAAMQRAFADLKLTPDDEEDDIDPRVARAYGRLPAADRREVATRGLAEVVRPSAAALLGGSTWSAATATA